ncbi:hypothetical protein GGS23DRAFT_483192 [Durotheca rogersii]|uniref:uncharacterized protein n=1 Tax=Durotheca rogersii TaxID=419775 RepID=UPI00221F8B9A|nr:uncharacterized protein GGS23DRAFT_483192 [Durotheca rogersii]KAI5864117.1 hypothetical protein GGS23DRAFT_483192 [Durotheca rogersii]
MLRSTRSLLAGTSRATASQNSPIALLPRSLFRVVTTAPCPNPVFRKVHDPRLLPLPPMRVAQYATEARRGLPLGKNLEEEKKFGQEKLESNPEAVTTESSVRHLYEPDEPGTEKPIRHGVRDDLKSVKDTFSMAAVPREPYLIGLAGTVPYLATSISTVYLSWDLNTEWPTTSSFANNVLIGHDSAQHLLNLIEPIQLGYGAVIISFLGAVHWGLEYAEKTPNPERMRFRYGLGVLASVIAWPTLFMPMDFALTSQFAAFVLLYLADSRASVRGWAPPWYGIYRFVLTAIVGAAILISLIGRMKVGEAKPRLSGLSDKVHDHSRELEYTKKWRDLEEKEKAAKAAEAERKRKEENEEESNKKSDKKKEENSGEDESSEEGGEQKAGEKDEAGNKGEGKEGGKNKDKGKGQTGGDE